MQVGMRARFVIAAQGIVIGNGQRFETKLAGLKQEVEWTIRPIGVVGVRMKVDQCGALMAGSSCARQFYRSISRGVGQQEAAGSIGSEGSQMLIGSKQIVCMVMRIESDKREPVRDDLRTRQHRAELNP